MLWVTGVVRCLQKYQRGGAYFGSQVNMHACTHYNQDVGTDKLWQEYADWAIQGVHRFVHNYAKEMGKDYISFTPIEIEIEILIFHYWATKEFNIGIYLYLCNYANWLVHTFKLSFTVIPPPSMICIQYCSLKSRTQSNGNFKECTTNNMSMKKTKCMSFIIYRFSSADQIWIHFFHSDN